MPTPKIKTFEAACKVLKLKPTNLPKVSLLPKRHQKAIVANFKLTIIAEALNGDWKPDWTNWNEGKYYPYFKVKSDAKRKSGFGLSFLDYVFWYTNTNVGSRLCYKDKETAEYAGKQFRKLYEEAFLVM